MNKLSENNCGEQITLDQVKQRLLLMLQTFADVCDKNGIRYYLSGGTLLGAVRHKGFIPWDDDIDVNVPRPDCEALQKLTSGKIGEFLLIRPNANSIYPANYWRLYDTSIVIENSLKKAARKPVYHPLFMDIFPIEGLPQNPEDTKPHYQKMMFSKKMFGCINAPFWTGKTFPAKVAHELMRPAAKLIGREYWFRKIQGVAESIPFGSTDYIGVMMTNIHQEEERVRMDEFLPVIKVEFEGNLFNAPKGYDIYLRQLYGNDYMQLPPEEKRQSHHTFRFYQYKNQGA